MVANLSALGSRVVYLGLAVLIGVKDGRPLYLRRREWLLREVGDDVGEDVVLD